METTDIMGTAEVAERLGVSVPTVNRWVRAGDLPGRKLGDGAKAPYVFSRAAVDEFAATLRPTHRKVRAS